MKRITLGLFSVLFLSFIIAAQPGPGQGPADEIEIQVSPQTILLNWEAKGNVRVTVHADVSYGLFVDADIDVWLEDDIQATYIKSDARGDLVAKFPYEELVGLLDVGYATLSLRAVATDGTVYTGTDQVRVIQP